MATFDEGVLGVSRPEKCGCQELLNKITLVQYGWLRRKCRRNALQMKIFKWPQQYVIVGNKCLYYFNNETSKCPEGAVSLYGFNRIVRASDITSGEALWAFKLEHVQPNVKSIYFASGSEREMVTWMKAIKAEMLNANNIDVRYKKKKSSLETNSNSSWDSGDYKELEESIYMEPVGSRISSFLDIQDKVSEGEDNNYYEHLPLPPRSAHTPGSDRENERSNKLLDSEMVDGTQTLSLCGYTLQKKVCDDSKWSTVPQHSSWSTVPQHSSEQQSFPGNAKISSDSSSYWDSVYFHGGKNEASEIMNRLSENGAYLVRKSDDNSKVLLLCAHQTVKKFRIIEKENRQVSLTRDGPEFETIEDLLYYYYMNNVPGVNIMLVTPYKLSSKYQ